MTRYLELSKTDIKRLTKLSKLMSDNSSVFLGNGYIRVDSSIPTSNSVIYRTTGGDAPLDKCLKISLRQLLDMLKISSESVVINSDQKISITATSGKRSSKTGTFKIQSLDQTKKEEDEISEDPILSNKVKPLLKEHLWNIGSAPPILLLAGVYIYDGKIYSSNSFSLLVTDLKNLQIETSDMFIPTAVLDVMSGDLGVGLDLYLSNDKNFVVLHDENLTIKFPRSSFDIKEAMLMNLKSILSQCSESEAVASFALANVLEAADGKVIKSFGAKDLAVEINETGLHFRFSNDHSSFSADCAMEEGSFKRTVTARFPSDEWLKLLDISAGYGTIALGLGGSGLYSFRFGSNIFVMASI